MPSISRPNFLMIVAEQFSAFADPSRCSIPVDAPNLKRLASESVRFDECHCNSPVCGPSRLSFLTGRYVCNNPRGYDNGSTLPSDMPTFAHLLVRGGYRTAISGRMHIHGYDVHHGFEQRLASEIINPLPSNPADLPGVFEPIRPPPPSQRGPYKPEFSDSPLYKHDEYVTDRACRFLRDAPSSDDRRPFALLAGYLMAHPSGKATPDLAPLYEKYLKRDLPLPVFTREHYDRLPEHAKRLHQLLGHTEKIFDPDYHRHETAWYFARIEYFDRMVGRLMEALDETGLDRETVVCLFSDHGDNMGRHGLWGKMNFYQEAQVVPFYLRAPGVAPRMVAERVSLVDLLPTLTDFGDCEISYRVDGKSLAPLVRGERAENPEAVVFSEYHGYLSPSDMYMAIEGDHKYCHHLLEPGELYDLKDDPNEENNLFDDVAMEPVRAALESEIRNRVHIEAFAEHIRDYNAQRQTVTDAMAASPAMQRDLAAYHERFRAGLDEPWWDGGKFISRFEGHLKGDSRQHHKRR